MTSPEVVYDIIIGKVFHYSFKKKQSRGLADDCTPYTFAPIHNFETTSEFQGRGRQNHHAYMYMYIRGGRGYAITYKDPKL